MWSSNHTRLNFTKIGQGCKLFGDQDSNKIDALPDNEFVWTAFYRSKVVLFQRSKTYTSKMQKQSLECKISKLPFFLNRFSLITNQVCLLLFEINIYYLTQL